MVTAVMAAVVLTAAHRLAILRLLAILLLFTVLLLLAILRLFTVLLRLTVLLLFTVLRLLAILLLFTVLLRLTILLLFTVLLIVAHTVIIGVHKLPAPQLIGKSACHHNAHHQKCRQQGLSYSFHGVAPFHASRWRTCALHRSFLYMR